MGLGEQIYVYRELLNLQGLYQHHGIDCGDGTVIHYRKPSEVIEQTSLATFARGNPVYLREYLDGFCFIPEIVIQRAKSRLGEQKYNLLFNNCEHFATWCKTGISDSQQIRDFAPLICHLKVDELTNPFLGARSLAPGTGAGSHPLFNALKNTDTANAQNMINKALGDIRTVWDNIQPQYQQALQERDNWQRVAQEALRRNREDLARAALQRKLSYQNQAQDLEKQLAELAKMTENLLKNSPNFGKNSGVDTVGN